MHFHVWMKTRRALRAKSASRKAWNEKTVFRAIDQIEALVKVRSEAFGLIDTTVSDKQFKAIEPDFFSSFRIGGNPQLQADGKNQQKAERLMAQKPRPHRLTDPCLAALSVVNGSCRRRPPSVRVPGNQAEREIVNDR